MSASAGRGAARRSCRWRIHPDMARFGQRDFGQVDFGEAVGVIGGVRQRLHFFCMDLPQSDACFVKAYPRETTEAFLDGHVAAFAFFGGVLGATSVLKQARRGVKLPDWLAGLMARKPFKLVAVALANKIARVIWALLVKGGVYKKPTLVSIAAA